MRITNGMLATTVTGNLNASLERLNRLQTQASTGKRIIRASDDPNGTNRSLSLRGTLAGIEQYARNVQGAKGQLASVDSALDNINKALQEARRLALSGANSTTDEAQRRNLATQVQQQIDGILREVNATSMDRHLFSGFRTNDAAVEVNPSGTPPYRYAGDDGVMKVPVAEATEIEVSLTAREILNMDGAVDASRPDALTVLAGLRDDLNAGNLAGIQQRIGQLEKASDNVVSLRGRMGVRAAQLDISADRLAEAKVSVSEWLSQVEDVDIAETMMKLQAEQNVYQAALLAASKSMQPSLADYLK